MAKTFTIGRGAEARACNFDAGLAGATYAETFGDVPPSSMFSGESEVVKGAVSERRREFATARHCARQAMRKLGVPAVPILPDADGAPRWPEGVVGSMTHCKGYRAALVARSSDLLGAGLDAEPHAPIPDEALELILRQEERLQVSILTQARPDRHWDRILFCAKEAVYKAWFPLTRRWLDFADVSVSARLDGSFRARVRVRSESTAGVDLSGFDGRWSVGRGLIVAATAVPRHRPSSRPALAGAA